MYDSRPQSLNTAVYVYICWTSRRQVDPLELVIWLPALCRKKEVPYCFIKGKSAPPLGARSAGCWSPLWRA